VIWVCAGSFDPFEYCIGTLLGVLANPMGVPKFVTSITCMFFRSPNEYVGQVALCGDRHVVPPVRKVAGAIWAAALAPLPYRADFDRHFRIFWFLRAIFLSTGAGAIKLYLGHIEQLLPDISRILREEL
jgi:hypothetical protein